MSCAEEDPTSEVEVPAGGDIDPEGSAADVGRDPLWGEVEAEKSKLRLAETTQLTFSSDISASPMHSARSPNNRRKSLSKYMRSSEFAQFAERVGLSPEHKGVGEMLAELSLMPLPDNWRVEIEDGEKKYINTDTGFTTYVNPAEVFVKKKIEKIWSDAVSVMQRNWRGFHVRRIVAQKKKEAQERLEELRQKELSAGKVEQNRATIVMALGGRQAKKKMQGSMDMSNLKGDGPKLKGTKKGKGKKKKPRSPEAIMASVGPDQFSPFPALEVSEGDMNDQAAPEDGAEDATVSAKPSERYDSDAFEEESGTVGESRLEDPVQEGDDDVEEMNEPVESAPATEGAASVAHGSEGVADEEDQEDTPESRLDEIQKSSKFVGQVKFEPPSFLKTQKLPEKERRARDAAVRKEAARRIKKKEELEASRRVESQKAHMERIRKKLEASKQRDGAAEKKKKKLEEKKREKAACKIQNIWRGFEARKRAEKVREVILTHNLGEEPWKAHQMAIRIQAVARGRIAKPKVESLKKKREAEKLAAIMLQKTARRFLVKLHQEREQYIKEKANKPSWLSENLIEMYASASQSLDQLKRSRKVVQSKKKAYTEVIKDMNPAGEEIMLEHLVRPYWHPMKLRLHATLNRPSCVSHESSVPFSVIAFNSEDSTLILEMFFEFRQMLFQGARGQTQEMIESVENLVLMYLDFGKDHYISGKFNQAIHMYTKAQVLLSKCENFPNKGELKMIVLNSMAEVYYDMAEPHLAMTYLKDALTMAKSEHTTLQRISTHLHMAAVCSGLVQNHKMALEYTQDALKMVMMAFEGDYLSGDDKYLDELLIMCFHYISIEELCLHRYDDACRDAVSAYDMAKEVLGASNPLMKEVENMNDICIKYSLHYQKSKVRAAPAFMNRSKSKKKKSTSEVARAWATPEPDDKERAVDASAFSLLTGMTQNDTTAGQWSIPGLNMTSTTAEAEQENLRQHLEIMDGGEHERSAHDVAMSMVSDENINRSDNPYIRDDVFVTRDMIAHRAGGGASLSLRSLGKSPSALSLTSASRTSIMNTHQHSPYGKLPVLISLPAINEAKGNKGKVMPPASLVPYISTAKEKHLANTRVGPAKGKTGKRRAPGLSKRVNVTS